MTAFPMIPYREFDLWFESGRIRQVVDLREQWMYGEERICTSVNIPYAEIEYRMNEVCGRGTVVFYCDRGAKSMVVCRQLWQAGYDSVDLAGGILNYRGKYIDRRPLGALQ